MNARARPTDAEFDELKRRRDDAVRAAIVAACEKMGWDASKVTYHASPAGDCYCACPDGPCQHIWNGPDHVGDCMVSGTCSRCGAIEAYHDMWVLP